MKFKVIAENGAEKELEIGNSTLKELRLFLEENQQQEDVFDIDDNTDIFYYIDYDGFVDAQTVYDEDDGMFEVANACKDDELMRTRALNETLNRLMWRFSMQNGGREIDWKSCSAYSINYNVPHKVFRTVFALGGCGCAEPYFKDNETAERCIEEVIKPFLAEHPDFEPNVY